MVPRAERAHELLEVCRAGLAELRTGPDDIRWKLAWAGTVQWLRLVARVLESEVGPLKTAQDTWWKDMVRLNTEAGRVAGNGLKLHEVQHATWEPAIFWQFVSNDRALLQHEAKLTPTALSTTITPSGVLTASGDDNFSVLTERKRTMLTGPFAGEDQCDVVERAILWWQDQIADIEARAASRGATVHNGRTGGDRGNHTTQPA